MLKFEKVSIGGNSDLGIGSIILPGVNIGNVVILGVGTVVIKDVRD